MAHLEARVRCTSGGGGGGVGPGEGHTVPLGQLKHEVGLQGALNMLGPGSRLRGLGQAGGCGKRAQVHTDCTQTAPARWVASCCRQKAGSGPLETLDAACCAHNVQLRFGQSGNEGCEPLEVGLTVSSGSVGSAVLRAAGCREHTFLGQSRLAA